MKAKVKYGSNASIPIDFEGPLVLIPDEIEAWLEKILHSEVSREQFQRKTKTVFPIEPLREAIINALVHRDYEQGGAKTYIEIDDKKIVVKSAGLPVSPILLEDVKAFRAPSLSCNPKITFIFNRMGLMEEAELGMETFRGMHENYNLPLPNYNFTAPYLSLTFSRSIEALKTLAGNEALENLNEEELNGFEWVKSKREVSKKDYATYFNFEDKKALRHLSTFKAVGLITDNGEKANSPKYRYLFKND